MEELLLVHAGSRVCSQDLSARFNGRFCSGDFLFVRVDSPVYTINTYGILEQHASCVHVPTSDATLTTNGGQTKTVTALLATPSLYPSASADTRDGAGLARGAALRVHACMYHKTKEEREK